MQANETPVLRQPERRAEPESSDDEIDLVINSDDQSLQAAPTAAQQVTTQTEKHAIPGGQEPSTQNPNIVGSSEASNGDNDSGPSTSASPSD